MTTTITIPKAEFNLAKAYAEKRNMSIDELVVSLIKTLPQEQDDDTWETLPMDLPDYSIEELSMRIEKGEKEFDNGQFITHEQMMQDLKKEFSWLQ